VTAAAILDFDGTLYRDEEAAHEVFRAAVLDLLDREGIEEPDVLLDTARTAVNEGRYTSTKSFLADQGITTERFEEGVHPAVCQVAAQTDRSRIIDELQAAGCRVDVLTNNSEQLVEQYLGQVGREVATVIGAETLPALKPDEDAFTAFFSEVPYTPDEAVYIDDQAENTNTAASLGMEAQHFDQGTRMDEIIEVVR
jgi:FMN phosphatase YigB (HAD superfamily)